MNPLAAAAARLQARRAGVQASAFAGALHNRLTADWVLAVLASADQERRGDIRLLRIRARELSRNNEHAIRFLGLLEENVVGHSGVRLQMKAKTAAGVLDADLNRRVEAAWADWSRKENASADGKLSFRGLTVLAQQTEATDGEYLLRLLPGFPNPHRFAVQLLDVDQLDTELNQAARRGTGEIRMGVEIDRWGRPVAYHMFNRHPFDLHTSGGARRERIRVPASEIVHEYIVQRVGQSRGITWFAPVLITSRMLGGYREAELVAARMAASQMGMWERDPEAEPGPDEEDRPLTMEASPGTFGIAPAGYRLNHFKPEHPVTAFKDFDKTVLRTIATGLRAGYNKLASDLEGVSFSSLRQDSLTEQDVWRILQQRKVENLIEPVFRAWLPMAATAGAVDLGTFDPREIARLGRAATWRPRGWDWVDPVKEMTAATLAVALGVDSRTRIAARRGYDLEEVLDEQQREREMAAERGLRLGGVARASGGAGGARTNGNANALANGSGNGDGARSRLVRTALRDALEEED